LRAIYDLSQPDRSLYIHTSGQSGNLLSPHYADFAAPWRDGEFIAMTMQRREIEAGALGTLVLAPK
jgi:penicillin amidase